MRVLEIPRTIFRESGGNVAECIRSGFYILWTPEKIRSAFAFGNGTAADFEQYRQNNKKYLVFIEA